MSTHGYIPARRWSDSSGFTLIEVLIVMGLMGVFVTLLLPNFNKVIPQMKVNKAATKLAADLQISRQTAISEMSYVRFFINPGGAGPTNGYATEVWDRDYVSTGVPGEPVQDPLRRGADLVVDFSTLDPFTGIGLSSVATEVRFTPLGTIVAASDILITLTHLETGYSRSVRVNNPIGKIEVLP